MYINFICCKSVITYVVGCFIVNLTAVHKLQRLLCFDSEKRMIMYGKPESLKEKVTMKVLSCTFLDGLRKTMKHLS